MQKDSWIIYSTARKSAGFTQELTAELLIVSLGSLRDYETGVRLPPDDVVARMVEIYGTPFLAYQHLRLSAELARAIIPEIKEESLPQAVVRLICRVQEFTAVDRTQALLKISEYGLIDQVERPVFNEILGELEEIVRASLTLRYSRDYREEQ